MQSRLLLVLALAIALPHAFAGDRPGAARLTSIRFLTTLPATSTADNWMGGGGNWSSAGSWSAAVPGSGSAVTIGNTSNGVVTEDLASASAYSLSILGGNFLTIAPGNALTVGTLTSVADGGNLDVGGQFAPGSTFNTGSMTNAGNITVGNRWATSPTTLNIAGGYSGAGGTLTVTGGDAGAYGLVSIGSAAPSTLTGTYSAVGGKSLAAIEWASGAITSIGDGGSNAGIVTLSGKDAFLEIGQANSNNALSTLANIASNGSLELESGATLHTDSALTNAGQLILYSSTMTIDGSLNNTGLLSLGQGTATRPDTVTVRGEFNNTGRVELWAGNTTALLNVTTAAPDILTGTYSLYSYPYTGTAAVEWASGGIVSIGDGGSNPGTIYEQGPYTYLETGATNSNSALSSLRTIASNGSLQLYDVALNIAGSLTNNGQFGIDTNGYGSVVQIGGSYSNSGNTVFGDVFMQQTSTMTVGGSLTNTGTLTVNGGWTSGANATLTVDGSTLTNSGTISIYGGSSGNGVLLFDGTSIVNTGTIDLVGGAASNTSVLEITGDTTLTGKGTIELSRYQNNLITGASPTDVLTSYNKIVGSGTIANIGLVNHGTMLADEPAPIIVAPSAAGFSNLGLITVNDGSELEITSVNGGTLTNLAGGTLTGGTYSIKGTLEIDGASIGTNAANVTIANNTGKIVDQYGNNALLGLHTNAAGGIFTLTGGSSLATNGGNFTNYGQFMVNGGSTFTVGGSGNSFTQASGTATINGTLAGAGSGTASLMVNGGTLAGLGTVDDAVTDSAIVQVGDSATSIGKLSIAGTYAQTSGGALNVTIGGTNPGVNFDQLDVTGSASLNGTLNLKLASGFTPPIGTTFDILNAGSITGAFATVTGVAINSSEHFAVSYNGDDVVLTVVSGPAAAGRVTMTHLPKPVISLPPQRTAFAAATPQPAAPHMPWLPTAAWHARDELGAPMAAAGGPMVTGGTPASAFNPMASMNHRYLEFGVSINAIRHTTPRRLLHSLGSGSPETVGYILMTPAR